METNNEIVLKQAPVIQHKLEEAGKQVTERIESLNIDSLVATEESLKSLKEMRAELNKELKKFEEQRKAVKQGVNKPYQKFEQVYKDQISDKYTGAVDKLKEKIGSVEMKLKEQKRNELIEYFDDFCASEKIDFLKFINTGIEVNLSTSTKKYKEQIQEFIERVKSDLALIKTDEYATEILVEYKKTLNASQAITNVRTRKQAEKEETEKAEQKQHSVTYVYEKPHPENEVLQAPVKEIPEKKHTATFEAYGTMYQLKSIGAFMRENGIEYKNL